MHTPFFKALPVHIKIARDFGHDLYDKKKLVFVYAPGSNDWGHIVFVLSVCLSVSLILFVCLLSTLTFTMTLNSKRKILHSWHAYSTSYTHSNDTKVNDLVTLTLTLKLKLASWTSLLPGA